MKRYKHTPCLTNVCWNPDGMFRIKWNSTFVYYVCHTKTLENDAHHLVVCLPRDQRLIHALDALDGRAKSMGENAGSDLDIDTLDGDSAPSLAPAFLELDREVGNCKAFCAVVGSNGLPDQFH
jgi:hypothetical protein